MSELDYDPPEREHDCCDRCGRGSCPGSGRGGEDACTWRPANPLTCRCGAFGGWRHAPAMCVGSGPYQRNEETS